MWACYHHELYDRISRPSITIPLWWWKCDLNQCASLVLWFVSLCLVFASSLVLKLLVSSCFHAALHVSNLAWQNQPRVNGQFIACLIPSPTLNTPTISWTPSTASSLKCSPSPDGFDLRNSFNNSSPPMSSPLQPTLPPVAPITPVIPVAPVAPWWATMPSNNVDIFYGDRQEGENPQNFLHAFHREMHSLATTNNTDIAWAFVDYLGASSQADLWFDDLTQATQESWAQLEAAFVVWWPWITQAKRSEQEIERELLGTLWNEKELGEKIKIRGVDVWFHVAWADKVTILINEANITLKMTHIWQVWDKLPDAIKDIMGSSYADWTMFMKAVHNVDLQRI